MKIEVLWDDMLWWLVNTDILGECTACSFTFQQSYVYNNHEDMNLHLMENRHLQGLRGIYFTDEQNKVLIKLLYRY